MLGFTWHLEASVASRHGSSSACRRLAGGKTSRKRQRRSQGPAIMRTQASHSDSQANDGNAPHASEPTQDDNEGEAAGMAASRSKARGRSGRGFQGRECRAARGRGGRRRRPSRHEHSPSSGSDYPSDNDEGLPVPIPVSPNGPENPPAASSDLDFRLDCEAGQKISSEAACDLECMAYFSAQPQLMHEQLSSGPTADAAALPGPPVPPASSGKRRQSRRKPKPKAKPVAADMY